MMWYNGGWGIGGLIMAVIMVLFFAVLIAGAAAVVHYFTSTHRGHEPGAPHSSSEPGWGRGRAEDLLDERFARGEIDEEEYKRRPKLLREHR